MLDRFREWFHRLRSFFRRARLERELDAELRSHLDMAFERNLAQGTPPEQARRQALLDFGGFEQAKENYRERRGLPFLDTLLQDLRFAFRMLRKSPGFTAVAVFTLALGIGANTAIFSLLNGLVLRDLPVLNPQQLARFGVHSPGDDYTSLSLPMFQEFSRSQKVFSSVIGSTGDGVVNGEINGVVFRVDEIAVTGNFQSELGATPEIGRLISPEDVKLDGTPPSQVVVLEYGFWQRRYGGARDVIGKTLKIENFPFTIIGVTRKGFRGISAVDPPEITIPLPAEPLIYGSTDVQKSVARMWLEAEGRLRVGVGMEQARAQLEALWPGIQLAVMPSDQTPGEHAHYLGLQLKVESGAKGTSFLRQRFTKPLYILLAIAGVVLLIACVNLASLLLARAASRGHELGLRIALGASRGRLARQMLTESVLLSFAGTLAGFALADWGSHALSDVIVGQIYSIPANLNLRPDWRILAFIAGMAIFTGVLFGLAPALRATREDPNAALQHGSRTLGRGIGGLGRRLIVTQVTLSVVLLTGAGLFVRTLERLHQADPGFRTHSLLVVGLFPKLNGYKNVDLVSYYHELTNRVSGLGGVESAGLMHMHPGDILEWTQDARVAGRSDGGFTSDFVMLEPGAFRTLGMTLLSGRSFEWQDDDHRPHVAIVSKNLAQKLFPSGNAIGQRLEIVSSPKWHSVEIIGIVGNASIYDIRKDPPTTVYVPSMQYGDYMGWSHLLLQTSLPPATIAGALRQTVESLGHEYVSSISTVRQDIDRSILQERVTAMLSAFFGGITLMLAAIGLYGLMAYAVTQRTREIGIRMALGAERGRVLKMVLRETLVLVGAGVGIGLPCALATTRLIGHMLYGLSPNDPVTLACVVGALLAVSVLAGYLPARRAMRVDLLVALRYE
jgi:predicted permease